MDLDPTEQDHVKSVTELDDLITIILSRLANHIEYRNMI